MPTVRTQVTSTRPPADVLRILTDFGPNRAKAWAGVNEQHLKVHDQGDNWADVTEGNGIGWERERYTWDAAAGTVSAVTSDSNLWGPGSRWDYRLIPDNGGTKVDVTLQRKGKGKGIKGKLVGALLPLVGKRVIGAGVSKALAVG